MNPDLPERLVLLAGASGLVGGRALERLLAAPAFGGVLAVVRRPLGRPPAERLRTEVVDFGQLETRAPVPARAACSALGTTMAQAGSRAAFRAVDHDAVLAFARWALAGGARTFAHVSSVGADPGARSFYLRVKGEVEQAVAALPFQRVVALRPGLLLGPRAGRPAESLARAVMPLFNPLLRGGARRYRAVDADLVAAALVAAATADDPGRLVWGYDEIIQATAPSFRPPPIDR
jgi:uncharacterized protein YbjT (DUF2867 family)